MSRHKALSSIILASLLACCAHTPKSPFAPPTLGFFALIHPKRPVLCVGMTQVQCDAVATAVDKIDVAVGFELLSHPKMAQGSDKVGAEATIITVEDAPNDVYYGVTQPLTWIEPHFIGLEIIALNPDIFRSPALYAAVILHELVHSIGGDHADPRTLFPTVERPSWSPGTPTELTPGDQTSLRAAYPNE